MSESGVIYIIHRPELKSIYRFIKEFAVEFYNSETTLKYAKEPETRAAVSVSIIRFRTRI